MSTFACEHVSGTDGAAPDPTSEPDRGHVSVGPGIGRALDDTGFAVVDLLTAGEVAELREAFDALVWGHPAFSTSVGHGSRVEAARADAAIRVVAGPAATGLLDDHVAFVAAFMSKPPGAESGFSLHQDWTYVDERECRSYGVWCPLVATGRANGALHVVPGSHRWSERPRGSNIPSPFRDLAATIEREHGVMLALRPGQAVVYDAAILHYSPPNHSDSVRPALNVGLAPCGAPLVHHWCSPSGVVEVFRIDGRYYLEQESLSRPRGYPLIESYPLDADPFDADDLAAMLRGT